jgi:hypothetical protein
VKVHHAYQDLGGNGCGSKSAFQTYFDDSNNFLPYEDLPFIFQAIQTKDPSKGIFMNTTKTKIFTLPKDHDTQSILSP